MESKDWLFGLSFAFWSFFFFFFFFFCRYYNFSFFSGTGTSALFFSPLFPLLCYKLSSSSRLLLLCAAFVSRSVDLLLFSYLFFLSPFLFFSPEVVWLRNLFGEQLYSTFFFLNKS
ncbi:hypothetical protein BDZ91DRAFT_499742 [Kalaharituber pfeilii]|nr:hypothetical protein BDZ91DRAFT_499742 [Kalaharituber pfeilii]